MSNIITVKFQPEQLTELNELVIEKLEQINNLIAHYENNLEAIASAGKDPENQQINYTLCLAQNNERKELYNAILSNICMEMLVQGIHYKIVKV
jgi:hypothetical protein